MAVDTSKFAVQQVFVVDAFDLDSGNLVTRFEELKTSTLSNNGTVVYAQGGPGNPKIIGFSHSKESSLAIGNAVITEGGMNIQTGNASLSLTNSTEVPFDEIIVTTAADKATTSYTATGVMNNEIEFAYLLNGDGSVSKMFTQAVAAAAGKFTYTTATKLITFNTGEVPIGSRILVVYHPTVASGVQITNSTDVFAKNVRLHCRTLFRDTCTGKDYIGVLIFYKAKAGEEYSFDLSADGEPVVHNITFEALKSCKSNTLWDIFIYDAADLS